MTSARSLVGQQRELGHPRGRVAAVARDPVRTRYAICAVRPRTDPIRAGSCVMFRRVDRAELGSGARHRPPQSAFRERSRWQGHAQGPPPSGAAARHALRRLRPRRARRAAAWNRGMPVTCIVRRRRPRRWRRSRAPPARDRSAFRRAISSARPSAIRRRGAGRAPWMHSDRTKRASGAYLCSSMVPSQVGMAPRRAVRSDALMARDQRLVGRRWFGDASAQDRVPPRRPRQWHEWQAVLAEDRASGGPRCPSAPENGEEPGGHVTRQDRAQGIGRTRRRSRRSVQLGARDLWATPQRPARRAAGPSSWVRWNCCLGPSARGRWDQGEVRRCRRARCCAVGHHPVAAAHEADDVFSGTSGSCFAKSREWH